MLDVYRFELEKKAIEMNVKKICGVCLKEHIVRNNYFFMLPEIWSKYIAFG